MSTIAKRNRNEVLDELLEYHQGKINEIRSELGYATVDRPRQIVIDGAINLKLDAQERRLVVTWEK